MGLTSSTLQGGQIPQWVNQESSRIASQIVSQTEDMRPVLDDARRQDITLAAVLEAQASLPNEWRKLPDSPASRQLFRQGTQRYASQVLVNAYNEYSSMTLRIKKPRSNASSLESPGNVPRLLQGTPVRPIAKSPPKSPPKSDLVEAKDSLIHFRVPAFMPLRESPARFTSQPVKPVLSTVTEDLGGLLGPPCRIM